MNTHTQNVLETPTSSRKLTLVAIILILQVIGISGAFAHLDPVGVAVSEAQSAECSTATLPHFPLQAGNQWSYTKKGPGGDEAWQVAVVTRADGGTASELQGYFGSTHTVCSATSGTVHEVTADTSGDSMWYDLGAPVGSAWRIHLDPSDRDLPSCIDGSTITIGSRTEHADVPAGSFDNVIRVDYTSPCSDAGLMAEWFAPSVGLIKRMEQSFAGPVTSVLETARVGGMILPRPAVSTSLLVDKALYRSSTPGISVDAATASGNTPPMLTANFILSNASKQASEFDFLGCPSITVTVYEKSGKALISARATDGSDCSSGKVVHVKVTEGSLALPISFKLHSQDAQSLAEGRYLVVATLDTLDAAALRPSASATIDIADVLTGGK